MDPRPVTAMDMLWETNRAKHRDYFCNGSAAVFGLALLVTGFVLGALTEHNRGVLPSLPLNITVSVVTGVIGFAFLILAFKWLKSTHRKHERHIAYAECSN